MMTEQNQWYHLTVAAGLKEYSDGMTLFVNQCFQTFGDPSIANPERRWRFKLSHQWNIWLIEFKNYEDFVWAELMCSSRIRV